MEKGGDFVKLGWHWGMKVGEESVKKLVMEEMGSAYGGCRDFGRG